VPIKSRLSTLTHIRESEGGGGKGEARPKGMPKYSDYRRCGIFVIRIELWQGGRTGKKFLRECLRGEGTWKGNGKKNCISCLRRTGVSRINAK